MALPVKQQLTYWGIFAAVFVLVLWFLGDVLLPFVLGAAIAYFIDPIVDRLENLGFSRLAATALITMVAVVIFVLLLVLVIPALIGQIIDLVNLAPQLVQNSQSFIEANFPAALDAESTFRQSIAPFGETLRSRMGEIIDSALNSASSFVSVFILFVIAPVVSVYLLLDWDRMIANIDALLPRDHAPTIRRLSSEIDQTLSSFIRGMGTVCLILGVYYAIALMLVGLNFGLAIGSIAGIITFIPYLGALIGGALAIGLALFQFWGDWLQVGLVVLVFMAGQFVEGNFLTPKLVGKSIGLHPVWLLLALSVFGAIFGFVGFLVAVPIAAALGVIIRFGVEQYKESLLYLGVSGQDAE
ncbi:MAG: AI-2E family transporter [Rhodobacteraceae bacterium]|nr:AI-2E family transporter [Paracoccaceae bacterium]